jgi:signal transduction histidine kinase
MRLVRAAVVAGGLLFSFFFFTLRALAGPEAAPVLITNLAELRACALRVPAAAYAVRLEGTVWWAVPAQGRLVVQVGAEAQELEVDWGGGPVSPGERVLLEGVGTVTRHGSALRLGTVGWTVDNDGVHGRIEKAGSVYLTAGKQPIRLAWFNGVEGFDLQVEYEGPGLARQAISGARLFRTEVAAGSGGTNWLPGLNYRCYEGEWDRLPAWGGLGPCRSGSVSGFDLNCRSRNDHVALEFFGFLEVPRPGLYRFYLASDDGSALAVGGSLYRLARMGQAPVPAPVSLAVGQPMGESPETQWAEVTGTVTQVRRRAGGGGELELKAGGGRIRVEVAEGALPASLPQTRVRLTGVCQSAWTLEEQRVPGVFLVQTPEAIRTVAASGGKGDEAPVAAQGPLPLLSHAGEVHRLKREEALRGYPVKLRGVVTCVQPEHQAFVLEDSTRGLYVVDVVPERSAPARIGDLLEVEGVTDALWFAPIVNARRVVSLGAGQLPEPIRPSWDMLVNGSLDAQYVEIEGVVTEVRTNGVVLRTGGGSVGLELRVPGLKPEELGRFKDALVRVRGCLLALWDYVTHRVTVGEARVYDADITVVQPAPADLFSSPRKTAAEWLLFDPQASVFQRVRVSGQIVCVRDGEYFLMDGEAGLRLAARKEIALRPGDLVDAVGFAEMAHGVSPFLAEAVVRKTGSAVLSPARKLSSEDLLKAENDATRVRVEATLVGARAGSAGAILELQDRVRAFTARLGTNQPVPELALGSRLELEGVYAARGGSRAPGQGVSGFEILLNSAADIRVLASPPWWTLERLLILLGLLGCGLAAMLLWISQLHRQVEERTLQLEAQIRERQRAESQRVMEQERARVAQDLHDELGAGLTEITMLAARAQAPSAPEERRSGYVGLAADKAREMVGALDEIVWAMNPRHDSLSSLVSYFSVYADRFLGLANMAWRLEAPAEEGSWVLSSSQRHQLFLAFKEALTNIVRHSGATEVSLSVRVEDRQLRLTIADNGRGLPEGKPTDAMDGIRNMRLRLERLQGRLEVESRPGEGTCLRFSLPLAE